MAVSVENHRAPERPLTFTPLLGLQGRLEKGGDALVPTNTVDLKTGIDQKTLPSTTELMSKASVRERNNYWETTHPEVKSKEDQLALWKKDVVKKITAIPNSTLGKEHGEFFAKMLGISDLSSFTDSSAQTLYDTYFGKSAGGNGAELFTASVFKKFNTPDGFNLETIKKHIPALEWMAGMFGKNSAELIAQLTDGHIDFLSGKDDKAFIATREKAVNELDQHEIDLLNFLTKGKTIEETPPPPKPITPVKPVQTPPAKPASPPLPLQPKPPEKTPLPVPQTKKEDLICAAAGKKTIAEVNMNELALEYHNDPIKLIKKMMEQTTAVVLQMKKEKKNDGEIKNYIREYLTLQIELDHKAFPADDKVVSGVPTYLPDGLSDMGSDKEVDPAKRGGREKIRIDKETLFEHSIDSYYKLFTTEFPIGLSQKDKELKITEAISRHIYSDIKYDYHNKLAALMGGGKSINMSNINELKFGVCRHHALDTQVLLQSLGIDSRLMKSDFMSLGAHANNLVHIENEWYLLDTTNPEYSDDISHTGIVYLKLLPEKTIDLNRSHPYIWELDETLYDGTKKKRRYISRNNMFYRIRDNRANPVPLHYS